eukprot:TRINITY_DN3725_c2_g2_i2.p1 TRINITY_DN3725_c2_g2~~TRINITY_DN3725_c2_g2_i2.p1  ORF type:complete len:417 (+),score=125.09 TRINITY_DN3725_c2_g2_i2:659-1909(+)
MEITDESHHEMEVRLRMALAAETAAAETALSDQEQLEVSLTHYRQEVLKVGWSGQQELRAVRSAVNVSLEESAAEVFEAEAAASAAKTSEMALMAASRQQLEDTLATEAYEHNHAVRAAEIAAARWFYHAEAHGWSQGEAAEERQMREWEWAQSRANEAKDLSANAAACEASALRSETSALRREALALRGEVNREETAAKQAQANCSKLQNAEESTLRSALAEVRAEATRGLAASRQLDEVSLQLKRTRREEAIKAAQVKELTDELFLAKRQAASVAAAATVTGTARSPSSSLCDAFSEASDLSLPGSSGPLPPELRNQTKDPISRTAVKKEAATTAASVKAADLDVMTAITKRHLESEKGPKGPADAAVSNRAALLRARAEGLRGEVLRWQSERQAAATAAASTTKLEPSSRASG